MKRHLHIKTPLIIVAFGLLVLGYFYFLDGDLINPVLVITNPPVTTKLIYRPGEEVYMRISYCKHRNIPATVEWTLLDTVITFYTPRVENTNEVVCKKDAEIFIEKIPMDAHAGDYHFSGTIIYRVNGLKDVQVPLKTNIFYVEK